MTDNLKVIYRRNCICLCHKCPDCLTNGRVSVYLSYGIFEDEMWLGKW